MSRNARRSVVTKKRRAGPHPLAAPLASERASAPPKKISHDRRNVDPKVVSASQRWRLVTATAHVVAKHGYASATIEKITARAGVTKKTFYKFFDAKDDAFLASYEAVDTLIERVVASGTTDKGDPLRSILATYLEALAAAPDLTAMLMFEALAASPRIRRQRAAYIERFAESFRSALPHLTATDVRLLLGGINELCVLHLTHHAAATLPSLEDDLYRSVLRFLSAAR